MLTSTANNLRLMIARRFPGMDLSKELEAVGAPDVLQLLYVELDDIHDVETLRRRLAELAAMAQLSLRS
ncbi:MAG: hypothetical protein ACREEM_42755, partial [Blastocatellia bacterium]